MAQYTLDLYTEKTLDQLSTLVNILRVAETDLASHGSNPEDVGMRHLVGALLKGVEAESDRLRGVKRAMPAMTDPRIARVFDARAAIMASVENALREERADLAGRQVRAGIIAAHCDGPTVSDLPSDLMSEHTRFVAGLLAELKPTPQERQRFQDAGLI